MRRRPYYLLWILLPLATMAALRGPSAEQRQMIADIDEGSVLAWARHITGQDPNDLTQWDDFESVAVIPGTSTKANGDDRHDDEVWVVVQRDVNGVSVRYVEQFQPLDWGDDPNYCWFVDAAGGTAYVAEVPATPAVPATYTLTYASEAGNLYGIPLQDADVQGFDAGDARNIGDGTVGLPYTGHPFAAGQTVLINGTTNYDGSFPLAAGTSANELVIADTYVAETLDGTETVVRAEGLVQPGYGGAIRTEDGNFYYSHNYAGATVVTQVAPDGTEDGTVLTWPAVPALNGASEGLGITRSSDSTLLYVAVSNAGTFKFLLSTGACLWANSTCAAPSLALDTDGNVYSGGGRPGYSQTVVAKLDAADGTSALLTQMGQMEHIEIIGGMTNAIVVDDDLGIVVGAGAAYGPTTQEALLYNLCVRTLDDSAGDTIVVGDFGYFAWLSLTPTVMTGCLVVNEGYIYALIGVTGGTEIHKLQWDGSSLTAITSWTGPTYGCGLFVDLWGNLVAVNNSATANQSTIFYYYDAAGTLLGTAGNLPAGVLAQWNPAAGGTNAQGNIMFDGDLGTPEVPGTPAVPATQVSDQLDGDTICVWADAVARGEFVLDGNDITDFNEADYTTIIAGLNYYSILETTDLHRKSGLGRNAMIQNVQGNFYETLGAHIGYDMTYSADWSFFQKVKLMKDAPARDANGTVGLPYSGEPFSAGEEIYIYGTTNYNGIWTLAADTNNVELRLTTTYTAETFDGMEWVVSNVPTEPFSGYKGPAPFLRGTNRKPKVYLWEWCPCPLTLRNLNIGMEVTFE